MLAVFHLRRALSELRCCLVLSFLRTGRRAWVLNLALTLRMRDPAAAPRCSCGMRRGESRLCAVDVNRFLGPSKRCGWSVPWRLPWGGRRVSEGEKRGGARYNSHQPVDGGGACCWLETVWRWGQCARARLEARRLLPGPRPQVPDMRCLWRRALAVWMAPIWTKLRFPESARGGGKVAAWPVRASASLTARSSRLSSRSTIWSSSRPRRSKRWPSSSSPRPRWRSWSCSPPARASPCPRARTRSTASSSPHSSSSPTSSICRSRSCSRSRGSRCSSASRSRCSVARFLSCWVTGRRARRGLTHRAQHLSKVSGSWCSLRSLPTLCYRSGRSWRFCSASLWLRRIHRDGDIGNGV